MTDPDNIPIDHDDRLLNHALTNGAGEIAPRLDQNGKELLLIERANAEIGLCTKVVPDIDPKELDIEIAKY